MTKNQKLAVGITVGVLGSCLFSCCFFAMLEPETPAAPAVAAAPTPPNPVTPSMRSANAPSVAAAPVAPAVPQAQRPADAVDAWLAGLPPVPPLGQRAAFDVALASGDRIVPLGSRRPPEFGEGRDVRIVGRTNLPDGTKLMFEIDGSNFRGQSSGFVEGGRFASEVFGPSAGEGAHQMLTADTYEVSVLMPYAETHTAEVRAVIGESGERLRGSLVHRDRSGTIVEWSARVELSGAPTPTFDAPRAYRLARDLIVAGRDMQSVRAGSSLADARSCGIDMRTNLSAVDALEEMLEGVSPMANQDAMRISTAAALLRTCVSCTPDALSWCRNADMALRGR